MSVHMTNLKEFQDMLKRRLAVASKKTGAKIVNKCALQVLIGSGGGKGAVNTTAKATRAQIRKDLNAKHHGWTFKGRSHSVKLIYLLASKMLVKQGVKFQSWKQWNTEVAAASQRIFKARENGSRFLAIGWLAAALDLSEKVGIGLRLKEKKFFHTGGAAAAGRATAATPGNLRAVSENASVEGPLKRRGQITAKAYAIVERGLNIAIATQTKDMEVYVVRKEMEKTLKQFSDK